MVRVGKRRRKILMTQWSYCTRYSRRVVLLKRGPFSHIFAHSEAVYKGLPQTYFAEHAGLNCENTSTVLLFSERERARERDRGESHIKKFESLPLSPFPKGPFTLCDITQPHHKLIFIWVLLPIWIVLSWHHIGHCPLNYCSASGPSVGGWERHLPS